MKRIITLVFLFLINHHAFSDAVKTVNVYVSPLSYISGFSDLGVDYFINENHLIGVKGSIINSDIEVLKSKGNAAGLRYRYMLYDDPSVSSWILTAGAGFFEYETTSTIETFGVTSSPTSSYNGIYQEFLVGYIWRWETFNMHLAAGLMNHDTKLIKSSSPTTNVTAEFDGIETTVLYDLGIAF